MKAETEASVLKACLDYLRKVKRWWAFRTNNIPVYDRNRGIYRKFAGEDGMADIYALEKGVSWWIETKRLDGKQSEDQKTFEKNVTERGGVYLCVHSVSELIVAINKIEQERTEVHHGKTQD